MEDSPLKATVREQGGRQRGVQQASASDPEPRVEGRWSRVDGRRSMVEPACRSLAARCDRPPEHGLPSARA
jgi:hypothetical protein